MDKTRKRGTDLKYARSLKGRYRGLKTEAKRRKKSAFLSFEDYCVLITNAHCDYCGRRIPVTSGYSLDRINNSRGYLLNNVVPCCGTCNSKKGDHFSYEEFHFITKALEAFRNKLKERKK